MLTVLRRVSIGNYAMLLFCVPAITYLLAGAFGYGMFYLFDFIAAGLILLSIAIFLSSREMILRYRFNGAQPQTISTTMKWPDMPNPRLFDRGGRKWLVRR